MSGSHIPQADSLQKLRDLVRYVAGRGVASTIEAGKAVGLSPRHASYYRDAGECLGLLQGAGDKGDSVEVTEAASRLLGTAPGTAAEARALRRLVNGSAAVSRVAPGLLGEAPPSREEIAAAIEREAGLSASVAERRAACLWRWRQQVLDREHPQLWLPFLDPAGAKA